MTDPRPSQDQPPDQGAPFHRLEERTANNGEPQPLPNETVIEQALAISRAHLAVTVDEAKCREAVAGARIAEAKADEAESEADQRAHEAQEAGHKAAAQPARQAMDLSERAVDLGLKAQERTTTLVMAIVVTLTIIAIQIAGLIVSPWFFPLNLLIVCLGYWAKQRRDAISGS